MDIYSCRLLVLNQQRVKCEIRNPQQDVVSECNDAFNYDQYHNEISRLSLKARENKIQADEIKSLGELLFSTLFNGNILGEFLRFKAETRTHRTLLRIELEIDEPSLSKIASLPWEFMYAPYLSGRGNFWVATDPNLAFIRRRPSIDMMNGFNVPLGEKMRIATVIASPEDKAVPYKDFWDDIKKTEQIKNNIKLLDLVVDGTKRNIDKVLADKPHIFHLLAHGDLEIEGKGNTGFVYLVDVTGIAIDLSGSQLAELFARYSPPLVVLQVCESGAQKESDALSSIASQVVAKNVPRVVAMQYPISNARTREFMNRFYLCLSNGETVERALQEGRREIALGAAGYASRDFATPILYLSSIYDGDEKLEVGRDKPSNTKIANIKIGKLRITVEFQNQLVDALLECDSVADPETRKQIIARLPKDIRYNIGLPNAGARVQVSNIVRICTDYQNGIEKLIESVEFFERNTIPMQNIRILLDLE